jgi:ferrochelatase
MSQPDWSVLLLAHGAPERVEDVPEFLLHVRNGRPLPPPALEEIKRRYELIGGGSPLLQRTEEQARALAERLGRPVYVGMRNWHPFIVESVRRLAQAGQRRVIALCLAPHNSRTSVGLYRKRLGEAVAVAGAEMETTFIEEWHDHPLLIDAFAEKVRAQLAEMPDVPVIFTAHSVPEKTIAAGDPYAAQARETAGRVAAAANIADWKFAFQSQGMTAEPWLGPTVESVLDELAAAGHRHVLLAPIGFLCDHVEILYDVDVVFRESARTRGLTLHRTESLNASPKLIEALAALVTARAAAFA